MEIRRVIFILFVLKKCTKEYYCFRTNVYEISESDDVERGTKIVMYLKPDCREYASEDTVRKVINKYSNFVNSPIKLNGSEINTIQVKNRYFKNIGSFLIRY